MAEQNAIRVPRRKSGRAEPPLAGRGVSLGTLRLLDLVHTTPVGLAREVLRVGQLVPAKNKVFQEELLYFFLGRPAYRVQESDQKSDYLNRFPFIFVVSASRLGTPHHVYALDTGGLAHGVFGAHPDPHVFLEDYELFPPNFDVALSHIDWAFGDNEAYFDGDIKLGLKDSVPAWDAVARAFLALAALALPGSNQRDMRASAIEVAYAQPVSLKGNLTFAIFPKQFIEDIRGKNATFVKQLGELGIKWRFYDWQPNTTPDDYEDQIRNIIREYMLGDSDVES